MQRQSARPKATREKNGSHPMPHVEVAPRPTTRESLIVGAGQSYVQRLRDARAVDLQGNARLETLPGGYVRVHALDSNKRHGDV